MAETDNFEEDLFADLYTDDAAQKAAAPEPEVKADAADAAEVKVEETNEHVADNGGADEEMYNGEQDMEDEIDFNLGNGNSYDTPTSHEQHGPGIKEDGKMFIGGLNWETTDQSLKEYFSQFGEVLECTVMRDGASGRSRGFGFLTFKDARTVNIVMVKEHYLDGKIIDPKRAIPRDEQEKTSKIFVGGVSQEATEQDFKEYFMQFGRVVDATLMMDKDTGRPRGFGFVTFDSEAAVDQCLAQPLEILGKPIEVKKAQPRGNMREEEEPRGGARGGKFGRRGNDDNQNANQAQQGGVGGQMAPGGMTPQLMAQYWQRMQQYFAMMQQQMAMGGGRGMPMGGGMNPAMMMQMQQMQAMQQQMGQGNRSQSPQSPGAAMTGMQGMNPAMMAQMQQMQQMQMQGMGGGAGGMGQAGFGGNGGGSNPGGRMGTPGYNAYEQQMFEQQKYEQQQARRSQRDQSQYGGGGYGMGGGGGPTSWEGMYDDVPQPAVPASNGGGSRGGRGGSRGSQPPQTPASAPPANAPTGPKNAGKPGANYRGGGRGGNRGFHPYAR
ncbi:related to heterogeneous nuclear ribonucleoprotein D0 [Phialocephala subalpina]|uniref:Related to heterogeneous nuclear ribonucleoprotein D0 n=1 Tax=Phialocephala subalpina TaxID=576137 RepID=A0A1L7X648_9HELO|nr:related to heterogeneous nuclear ribonucleoprotein D0 [Phialocephala subalpina]